MFNWLKSRRGVERQLEEIVSSIAVQVDDVSAFRLAAAASAKELTSSAVHSLKKMFHKPPRAPAGFGPEERGLSAWLSAWQFAIFELYFNFRESALPVLREVAYGEYDWTQGNAIEVLCRLAAGGVETRAILDELKNEFPAMRFEARLYAVGPLLAQAESSTAVAAIVEELMSLDAFREAVEELTEDHNTDGDSLNDANLHGTVTAVEVLDEQVLKYHVVGSVFVKGQNYFSFKESNGHARIVITEETRLQKLTGGVLTTMDFRDIAVGLRVAIGFYSFTEQSSPIAVYPESLTLLDE